MASSSKGPSIVPADGKYTFTLDSDDGSRLTLDGQVLLTRDGIHGEDLPQTARVDLNRGRVPIRLDYFQAKHGLGLHVTWAGPDFAAKQLVVGNPDDPEVPKKVATTRADFARSLRRDGPEILGKKRVAHYFELRKELDKLKKQDAPADRALIVTESGPRPLATNLMLRCGRCRIHRFRRDGRIRAPRHLVEAHRLYRQQRRERCGETLTARQLAREDGRTDPLADRRDEHGRLAGRPSHHPRCDPTRDGVQDQLRAGPGQAAIFARQWQDGGPPNRWSRSRPLPAR